MSLYGQLSILSATIYLLLVPMGSPTMSLLLCAHLDGISPVLFSRSWCNRWGPSSSLSCASGRGHGGHSQCQLRLPGYNRVLICSACVTEACI